MTIRRVAIAVMIVAILAGAYGAGLLDLRGPAPDRAPAEIVAAAVCRPPRMLDGVATPPPELASQSAARPGTVPDGFVPVEALTCDADLPATISAEREIVTHAHRWAGDFDLAVRMLDAPSQGRRLISSCGVASVVPLPDLWLIDAGGRAVRPSYPVDDCGFQRVGGLREVQALTEVETIPHRFTLFPAGVEQLFSCTVAPPAPQAGAARLEVTPLASVCEYRRDGDGWVFGGARRLDPSFEISADTVPAGQPEPPCEDATRAVGAVLSAGYLDAAARRTILVELDGCRRLVVDGAAPAVAPEWLVTALG